MLLRDMRQDTQSNRDDAAIQIILVVKRWENVGGGMWLRARGNMVSAKGRLEATIMLRQESAMGVGLVSNISVSQNLIIFKRMRAGEHLCLC